MATVNKKMTGFSVSCPFCRDEEATIVLDLNHLDVVTCSSCDESFTPRRAAELAAAELARWEAVVAWVELAGAVLAPGA